MHPEQVLQPDERRSEPRLATSGQVTLHATEPLDFDIFGELLDLSAGGFRAKHACRDLHSGQVVRFRHDRAAGEARVVWNRIDNQYVESGFFIL